MRALLLASVMLVPAIAAAQEVPAIQASAAAQAGVSTPNSFSGTTTTEQMKVPPGLPPPVHVLSPSAPLNAKEKSAAAEAAAWRNHNDKPSRGEDGVLRWVFGASLPSVVCSPLQVCDVTLQPGEVVNSIHVGDKVRWQVMPAVSGLGTERTTHLIVKPTDAGLVSSMLVFTDKRTYSIKLISTQSQWTPLTAFNYPETAQSAWAAYGATMGSGVTHDGSPLAQGGGVIDFNYSISGSAAWRPVRVYAQGGKTYIEFPKAMQYGTAPALIGLANDGGLFTSPSEQMLRYRVVGDRYMVDGVLDRAELVTGVGSGQEKIEIRRSR
jgi:type IV secretion system protein TrbG